MHKPVVQEEVTGCGIASVANILGKTYAEMKAIANAMGIHASDTSLWSDTQYVRRLLSSVEPWRPLRSKTAVLQRRS
ncbi:hypothetical protein CK507_05485 [Pseudomonas sp. WN033]|nr:hypothetical protein CK507_05485 [Pseudomonas sp. WN033]